MKPRTRPLKTQHSVLTECPECKNLIGAPVWSVFDYPDCLRDDDAVMVCPSCKHEWFCGNVIEYCEGDAE